jgi:hypothetical protein
MVQIVARLTASSWRFAWWVASHTDPVAQSSATGDAERARRSAFCQWNAHGRKLPCRELTVFVFFSSRLGCLGSLLVSAIGTIVILIILDVI